MCIAIKIYCHVHPFFWLHLTFVGLVIALYPQLGQNNPSHFINILQDLQRLCPGVRIVIVLVM
jgi:hypothetical protein